MTAEEHWQEGIEAMEAGDMEACLASVGHGLNVDSSYKPLYKLAADALNQVQGEQEAILFQDALDNFESEDPFYELGYHFMDVHYYYMARPFLARANALNPEDANIAYEYSLALGALQQVDEGIEALKNSAYREDFWAAYRLYYLSALRNQDLETAKEFMRHIRQEIYKQESQDEDDLLARERLDQLQALVRRVEAISPQENNIRDWHFAQYGGAILNIFNSESYVAGGRYVAVWSTLGEINVIVQKLCRFLAAMDRKPNAVLYCPDRGSEILAEAVGGILNLPTLLFTEERYKADTCLVIASEADALNEWPVLVEVLPDRTVFALTLNWLKPCNIVPDVVGVLAQFYNEPWDGGGMKLVDFNTNQIERTEADFRPAAIIAADMVNEPNEIEAEYAEYLAFYSKNTKLWQAHSTQKRYSFSPDSPVKGVSFGG